MTVARGGVAAGLACALPVFVWATGELVVREPFQQAMPGTLANGVGGLWTAQAVAVAVFAPWVAVRGGWPSSATALGALILAPLPLLGVAWLTGAVPLEALGRGLLALAGFALLLCVIGAGVRQRLSNPFLERLVVAAWQAVAATAAFAWRGHWLAWVGL